MNSITLPSPRAVPVTGQYGFSVARRTPEVDIRGALLFTAVTLLGGIVPARRAAKLDPMLPLRDE